MAVAGRQLKREEDELRRKSSKRFTYSKLIVIIPDALLIAAVIAFIYSAVRILGILEKIRFFGVGSPDAVQRCYMRPCSICRHSTHGIQQQRKAFKRFKSVVFIH